MKTWKR